MSELIIAVTGGRAFWDWYTVELVLGIIGPSLVVHGCATGADQLSDNWAKRNGVDTRGYPIRRGKGEDGFQRNQRMLDSEPHIDLLVAFQGNSGTADMIRRARKVGIYVIEVK